ncbi:MAG: dATP/dGTP diphosphohydrolase domain-containing protein [Gammaproteobacteria bacterium]
MTDKSTNPKDAIGGDKLPLHLWPETATIYGSLALLDGALKYGRSNFRAIGVRASVYYDAARRHLNAWFEGEDADPDSGLPHLSHTLACLAILVEALAQGNLNDDRMYPTRYRETVQAMTPHVARLRAKYADRAPRHFTILDKPIAPTPAPALDPSPFPPEPGYSCPCPSCRAVWPR